MDKLIKSPSRSFSVRVQNYLEACRVCMTLPPKKKSRTEQFWSICSVKAAGADLFLIDALAYISGKDIDKNEKLYPQTICPKCVIDINTILKPLQDLKTTIERTELSWKAFKKERLKHDQGDSTGASYEITEYVVEEEEEDAELAEEEPEAMDAVAFLLKNMTKDGGEHKGSNADDDESEDDLGMSIEQEAQSEETILPNNQTTVFTIIDYPTQRVIKTENNDQPAAPESPPPERKPYERRPKPNEATISYEDRKHVCEVCQKRFLKKSNLIDHLRLHANMKIFKCDFCDRSFVQMGNYKQHLRTHTEEKPFTCKFCNKSYTQSSALKIHIRTHTGERSYQCKDCDKAFTNASDLRKHGILHDPQRKLICEFCTREFSQKVHLKNHLKRSHQDQKFDLQTVVDRANEKVLRYIRSKGATKKKPE